MDAIHEAEMAFYRHRLRHRLLAASTATEEAKESLPTTTVVTTEEEKGGLPILKQRRVLSDTEHEILRERFLVKVKQFMTTYLIKKQFQLEDLSNRFIVPSDYFQYKLNFYPQYQSPRHVLRYDFYHALMFPHHDSRRVAGSNTVNDDMKEEEAEEEGGELEEDLYSSFFNSPRGSPTPKGLKRRNPLPLQSHNHASAAHELDTSSLHAFSFDHLPEIPNNGQSVPSNDQTENRGEKEEDQTSTTEKKKKKNPEEDKTLPTSSASEIVEAPKKKESLHIDATAITAAPINANNNSLPSSSSLLYSQQLKVKGYGRPLTIDFRYLLSTKVYSLSDLLL